MKTSFVLCSLLLGSSVVAHAQAPVGSRIISRAEAGKYDWPKFRANADAKYDYHIAAMQWLLKNQGFFKTKPDGVFGSGTTRAVKNFQRAKGLPVDGVTGPRTWARLCVRIERGDSGSAVRALQILLNTGPHVESDTGYRNIYEDGSFGEETETRVSSIQEGEHMTVDGIVGAQTWSFLLTPMGDDE